MRSPFGRPTPAPGPVFFQNVSLRDIIAAAYDVDSTLAPLLVAGGPARILESRFDINARRADGAAVTDTFLIVRIQPFIDRPLTDATGLTGTFAWSMSFSTRPESTTAPAIYTALQEQLGLKADRRTAPFDVVVIDSVEMPTPN